ncbi:MAG: UDP-3-O-[3-hydroxymyristoyl] N-acetylglucosamine deacetylase [Proteobacteria bacterium]|nr:UDP-3-O-[3-hydroxymyristoyl] N-acetylglucosamine deacetylase [Pseudomonadota bacterium]
MPRDFEPLPASLLSHAQKTLARAVSCSGSGTHGGQYVSLVLQPAPADSGIVFERSDLSRHNLIPALWNLVQVTPLCTQIVNAQGAEVRTIEHIMAALYASGIDNARIVLDGPEVPLMDGASAFFMNLIEEAGIRSVKAPRRFLKITRPIEVRRGDAFARLEPASTASFHITIAYPQHQVGEQSFAFDFGEQDFAEEVAGARTFGFEPDIEALRRKGLTLGCTMDNAILINAQGQVANPEGYRFPNELARHKLLDAIGDLSLAGAVVLGRFTGNRSGHALNDLSG